MLISQAFYTTTSMLIFLSQFVFPQELPTFHDQQKQFTQTSTAVPWWEIQSIDTMKYSRDMSRQFLQDPEQAQVIIDQQIAAIANTGATHVGISTPYDEEFLPVIEQWTAAARQHQLKIWFRGNWSGWEGWFEYPIIGRQQHLEKTRNFILENPNLFEEGDIFTACPECENGGPGDPRLTGDIEGHRQFLINEYQLMQASFHSINRNVRSQFNPMNADVARLIMDPTTTQQLGGIVVIDHYVSQPKNLSADISEIVKQSEGRVVLGEFGAPIPDIHGSMTSEEQSLWIEQALEEVVFITQLMGINYWTSFGGSTALWHEDGTAKPAVEILEDYFKPNTLTGTVKNKRGRILSGVVVRSEEQTVTTNSEGVFVLPYRHKTGSVEATTTNYLTEEMTMIEAIQKDDDNTLEIVLESQSLFQRQLNTWEIWLRQAFGKFAIDQEPM